MKRCNLFYKYYDFLFDSKNYDHEVNFVKLIYDRYNSKKVANLLEVGCGSGSHTTRLSQIFPLIDAIDIDENMIDLAQTKILNMNLNNVKLHLMSVEDVLEKKYELVLALFNVVTYLPNKDKLKSFFYKISDLLADGGIFIFDCWNGRAALQYPPKSKRIKYQDGKLKLDWQLTSKNYLIKHKTTLTYHINVCDLITKKQEKDVFSFDQYLWTPEELFISLRLNKIKILQRIIPFKIDDLATDNDWKHMYICKKE